MRYAPLLLLIPLLCLGCDRKSPPPATGSAASGGGGAGSVQYDRAKAMQEIDELQTRLQTALDQNTSIDPVTADARRYVEKYPDVVAGHVLLGQIALMHGDFAGMKAQYELALDIDPRQAELQLAAGTASLQLDDFDAAEKHFNQAVSLDTRNALYRLHLANLYAKRNQFDKAQAAVLEAINLDSTSHKAYAMLSDISAKQNKLDLAIDQLDRAIALAKGESKYEQAYITLKAKLQLRANRPDAALTTLSALPPEVLGSMPVSELLASCWAMQGRPERAAAHYEQLVILEPTHADAMAEAAKWMIKADRLDDARKMLEQLKKVRPEHAAIAELEKALAQ